MPPRILVFQLGSIGDTVVSIPALQAVRRHYGPQAEICLLHDIRPEVNVTPAELLAGGAEVDRFMGYTYATGSWRKLASVTALWWRLTHHRFQVVVYLLPCERSLSRVRRDERFFRLCGITSRVGFHAFPDKFLYPADAKGRPARVMHEALCRLERLRQDGVDVSVESDLSRPFLKLPVREVAAVTQWLGVQRQHPERSLVAICPGSKQPANLWPVERFIEIGRRLIAQNRFELLVVGGPAEHGIGEQMIEAWASGVNAAGHFSVLGSATLLSLCAFMVGLDTGTTHLAAAVGVPCVAMYGDREHPGRWEPLGHGHILVRHPVPCGGCRLRICSVEGHPCMTGIGIEEVWQAIQDIQRLGQMHRVLELNVCQVPSA